MFLRSACVQLASLEVEWQDRVHDRTPAIHVEDLAGNKTRFLHAEQHYSVADIFRSAQPTHRGPAALVPDSDRLLDLWRQNPQDTALNYVRRTKNAPGLIPLTVIRRSPKATAKYRTSDSIAALAAPMATHGCQLPVRPPGL